MNQRQQLLASIAETIQDYQGGSLPQPITNHIDQWVKLFDDSVQLPILQEIDHVLKNTYFSKARVCEFLRGVINNQKLTGVDKKTFWQHAKFLDIQGGGNSQSEMLSLFSEQLTDELGIELKDCSQGNDAFIYLDDGIFTGNRVRNDLEKWIRDDAPAQATVYVICIALHKGGWFYANEKIQSTIKATKKTINIECWRAIELEDRKTYSNQADVLRPTEIPLEEAVIDYVEHMKYAPTLRTAGNPGAAGIFSSDAGKILLEQEFLIAGVYIRKGCPNLGATQRPLGHITLDTLGFGSLIVTYRNCPNNAPLALWVGDPWYPLFPRITNTQTAIRKIFANHSRGND